jgi:hypothetical protein
MALRTTVPPVHSVRDAAWDPHSPDWVRRASPSRSRRTALHARAGRHRRASAFVHESRIPGSANPWRPARSRTRASETRLVPTRLLLRATVATSASPSDTCSERYRTAARDGWPPEPRVDHRRFPGVTAPPPRSRASMESAFTPVVGASLLHVAAESGNINFEYRLARSSALMDQRRLSLRLTQVTAIIRPATMMASA